MKKIIFILTMIGMVSCSLEKRVTMIHKKMIKKDIRPVHLENRAIRIAKKKTHKDVKLGRINLVIPDLMTDTLP